MSTRHALVTGFPGFIARRLVRKLLASDDHLAMTLVAEPRQKAEAERELAILETAISADPPLKDRVRIMMGDITWMDIGLSGAEFRTLISEVTEVYHLAAVHSINGDKSTLTAVNV